MKQRIANQMLRYSALTLSVLGIAAAHAQLIEIEPPVEQQTTVQQTAPSALTTAQPVVVTPSMSPQMAPVAGFGGSTNVAGATPDGASSSANSNGTGTQINLNIRQGQEAEQAQITDQSRLNELQMARRVREDINNERALEKIEEDRITGERVRTRGIERFDVSGLQSAPVTAMSGAGAYAGDGSASATAIATVTTDGSSGGLLGDVRFKISPVLGTRWFQNNGYSVYRPRNSVMGGIAFEGQVSRFLGIEANFLYGRDNFQLNNGYGVGGYYGGAGMAGGPGMGGGYGPQMQGYGMNNGMLMSPGGYAIPMPQYRNSYDIAANAKMGYQFGKVNPYAIAGIGGLLQRYMIDDAYTTEMGRQAGWSRSTNYLTANYGLGVDANFARNFGAGLRMDYQAILNRNNSGGSPGMDMYWGDARNRFRLTGTIQVVF